MHKLKNKILIKNSFKSIYPDTDKKKIFPINNTAF